VTAEDAAAGGRSVQKRIGSGRGAVIDRHAVTMLLKIQGQILAHDCQADETYICFVHVGIPWDGGVGTALTDSHPEFPDAH
jgi:hypothetical protein